MSLFTRLILVFLFTALGLFFVSLNTFRDVAKEKPDRLLPLTLLAGVAAQLKAIPSQSSLDLVQEIVGDFAISGRHYSWINSGATLEKELTLCENIEANSYQVLGKNVIYRGSDERCLIFFDLTPRLSSAASITILIGSVVSVAILILAYYIVYKLYSPINELNDGIKKIAAGDIHHRLTQKYDDEIGELVNSVNVMAERIEEMLNAKKELLLAVSHELRSPLTQTKILIEMVSESELKVRLKSATDRLACLVASLLDAEKLKQQHAVLSLNQVDMVEITQALIDEQSVNCLSLNVQGDPRSIVADQLRLHMMLKNIVQNAIKYSDGTDVAIKLVFSDKDVEIRVRDRGPGIPEVELNRLGEAFYRPDASRTRTTGGYGLGIYLAQAIAKAHGGTFSIESKTNVGTIVLIKLPL